METFRFTPRKAPPGPARRFASAAGGRARNQSFILDGGNATNAVGLTRPQQLTSLPGDAMQEFKVITNNYSAEFGHSTGGVVSMSTRSGTNDFRGSLFEAMRHDALDALNYFAVSKPKIRLNQFGGTYGGPVMRNRSFFFGSWERTRQETSDTLLSTVPTLANRQGDFSDLRTSTGHLVPIYDPLTRQPFPGNIIPRDRLDPVALAAIQYYPAPNRPGTSANANNFVGNNAATLDRDIIVARVTTCRITSCSRRSTKSRSSCGIRCSTRSSGTGGSACS